MVERWIYTERAEAYVSDVLSDRRPAGQRERWAVERWVRDHERAAEGAWPYVYNPAAAEHACAFIERLPHVKGQWAARKETIRLEPWQTWGVCSMFGWLHRETGLRRFRRAYWEVPRKNAKSALASGIALYMLCCDGEEGPEVLAAATKAKQARIVFDTAAAMAKRTPELLRRTGLEVQANSMKVGDVSIMQPLEAKKLDGHSAHCAIIDEYHEHPTSAVYDAMNQSTGAREQSLVFVITTAGEDIGSPCYEMRELVESVLSGLVEVEALFGVIYAADPGDDPWNVRTWVRANPNYGVSVLPDSMRTEADEAKASPPKRAAFLRKRLNVWTQMGSAAFDLDGLARGRRPGLDRGAYSGAGETMEVATGFDLSQTEDLSSVVTALVDGEDVILFGRHWAPERTVEASDTLRAWAAEGLLEVAPGALIEFGPIEDAVAEDMAHFAAREGAYDPHLALQSANRLGERGFSMVAYRQTPMMLDRPFQRLIGKAADGRLLMDDPVLEWMFANVISKQRGDFLQPVKFRPKRKIDGAIAAMMAVGRLLVDEPTEEPVYERRGLRVI